MFTSQNNYELPGKIGAHKIILAAASDVFENEFFGSFESEDKVIIVDASQEVFQVMIDYIYNKQPLNLNEYDVNVLAPLYYLADKYIISDLSEKIVTAVAECGVSRENVLGVAVMAEASPHLPLSEALNKAVHSFLEKEFNNDASEILKFFTEADEYEKHALVILNVLKVVAGKGKKKPLCSNCKVDPCLHDTCVTWENFVPGAMVKEGTSGNVYVLPVTIHPWNNRNK